jgi:hypothetical protein
VRPIKIKTNFDYPPIPLREFDWSAVTDNYEPGHPVGYGRTEDEAVCDLKDQLQQLADYWDEPAPVYEEGQS